MKKSRYNIFFNHDNKEFVFNSMSCALAEIGEDFKHIYDNLEKVKENKFSEEEKKLYDDMHYGNYIISDEVDELTILQFRNNRGKFSSDMLSYVIAPTLACNFACPYCFEQAKPVIMSEEVQEIIIENVRKNAKKGRNIDITWYGGEPLLAKNIIFSMAKQMIEICDKYKVNYFSNIITNGYLISENDIEQYKKSRISAFQITIDGPREIHNTRRILKATPEIGTFDQIIGNVMILKNNEIGIAIRINIDKQNIENTKELIRFLKDSNLKDVSIHFGHVSACTDSNEGIANQCLSNQQYADESLKLQEYLFDMGLASQGYPHYPGIKANYCGADSMNTYVIDPEGYKYKCWNEVGMIDLAVGNLMWNEDDYPEQMVCREMRYMTYNPMTRPNCKECEVLPICMGGCPYEAVRTNNENCEKWKYNLTDILKKTYEQNNNV